MLHFGSPMVIANPISAEKVWESCWCFLFLFSFQTYCCLVFTKSAISVIATLHFINSGGFIKDHTKGQEWMGERTARVCSLIFSCSFMLKQKIGWANIFLKQKNIAITVKYREERTNRHSTVSVCSLLLVFHCFWNVLFFHAVYRYERKVLFLRPLRERQLFPMKLIKLVLEHEIRASLWVWTWYQPPVVA